MSRSKPPAVSDKHLAALAKMGVFQSYPKNELIISEGSRSDTLFILVQGQVKVFTCDSNGRELVLNILQAGEMFGEMFLDGGERSTSVKAIEPSQCVVLEEGKLRRLIKTHPDLAEVLIFILIARLRHATRMIKSLVLSDVYGRTTTLLNELALIEGKKRVVPANLTQQEIADRVGATREMVNHVIGDLIADGHLSRDAGRRLVFSKDLPTE